MRSCAYLVVGWRYRVALASSTATLILGGCASRQRPLAPPPAGISPQLDVRLIIDEPNAALAAAAGGPDVHPHATDPDCIRARWDRDAARAPDDMRELASFAGDVLSGRITTSDSVARRGASYFGVQGPWYTVDWLMASTVEKQFGRAALIGTLCTPVAFLRQYNDAARRANGAGGATLPTWSTTLLDQLAEIGR